MHVLKPIEPFHQSNAQSQVRQQYVHTTAVSVYQCLFLLHGYCSDSLFLFNYDGFVCEDEGNKNFHTSFVVTAAAAAVKFEV
jgi:hypothetical protein